ncbi:MAG: hypothetical protein IPL72_06920 [Sulfuritalea sp.]|nr:hypothetical protein [Sulfuritalea sp.]
MVDSLSQIRSNPVLARAVPFLLFIAFLMANSVLAPLAASIGISLSWLAVIRGVIVALVLAWFWRSYTELRNTEAASATHWLVSIGAGIAVFIIWIEWGQSGAVITHSERFIPLLPDGSLDWPKALLRLAGLALVVPVIDRSA